jgi:hypothetical protein
VGRPAGRGAGLRATGRWEAAARQFCDAFVSGHDLAALEEVVAAVGAETR